MERMEEMKEMKSLCDRSRDGKVGRAMRVGPLVKIAGRTDLFNPLTRISSPRISPQPARANSGAGRAGPLTRKKKKLTLSSGKTTQLSFHKISKKETLHNRVDNFYV